MGKLTINQLHVQEFAYLVLTVLGFIFKVIRKNYGQRKKIEDNYRPAFKKEKKKNKGQKTKASAKNAKALNKIAVGGGIESRTFGTVSPDSNRDTKFGGRPRSY
jgi:hypothetical protein